MIPDGRCGLASGRDDCERLDFFVNGDPDFPDMNRLFTDCVWDADTQRWERKQQDSPYLRASRASSLCMR
jgi:hypothetical protein